MKSEIQHLKKDLPLAIIGMGISGEATLKLLLSAGVPRDQITTFDEKKEADFNNPNELIIKKQPKTLIVSPGIPLSTSWIVESKKKGIKISSELEIASYFLTSEKIVAITGSIGKSTTAAMLGSGAQAISKNNFLGGNFGIPLAIYANEIINGKPKAEFIILELSSFQLENYSNLKADVGVITFLSANHLERYPSQQEYYQTKLSLFEKVKNYIICNANGGDLVGFKDFILKKYVNLTVDFVDRNYFFNVENQTPQIIGDHNLDNLAVSYAVGKRLNWPLQAFTAMLQFSGLPHRLENCGSYKDILFLNDSKSTSIASVLEATKSVQDNKKFRGNIHLLLGGRDKSLPWKNLNSLKNYHRFHFHFFGECGDLAQKQSGLPGSLSKNLRDCLEQLFSELNSGDIVLLSPGGTSLDEFKGFEDRGNFFKSWVQSKFDH